MFPETGTQPLTFAPCGVSGRLNGPDPQSSSCCRLEGPGGYHRLSGGAGAGAGGRPFGDISSTTPIVGGAGANESYRRWGFWRPSMIEEVVEVFRDFMRR